MHTGSLIGAYFIAGQLPYFGPEIYYDLLTSAGPEFVDSKSILRSIGFGLLDLRVRSLVDLVTDRFVIHMIENITILYELVFTNHTQSYYFPYLSMMMTYRMGRPVLNLDYLLTNIVQKMKPLDFTAFEKKQQDRSQVLKVVASGLLSKQPVVFSYEDGNFRTLSELTECMRASMLLPGVTGNVARLKVYICIYTASLLF